jgi:FKBP-type peptidyl-prolyl cis-trans isomerase SlyD
MSAVATKNKVVSFTYRIKDAETEEILEITDIPMDYVHGVDGEIFVEIENAFEGKSSGYKTSIHFGYEQAFGPHRPELTFTDDIQNTPPEYRQLGAEANFENSRGDVVSMKVVKIENGKVFLDGNHPFAGKDLVYEINLTSVRLASKQEIETKAPANNLNK